MTKQEIVRTFKRMLVFSYIKALAPGFCNINFSCWNSFTAYENLKCFQGWRYH